MKQKSKESKIRKIFSKLQGPEFLPTKILEGVLDALEGQIGDISPVLLKNLVPLLVMDEIIDIDVYLSLKIVGFINLMLNITPDLTGTLKTLGYVEIRDSTLIILLRLDLP